VRKADRKRSQGLLLLRSGETVECRGRAAHERGRTGCLPAEPMSSAPRPPLARGDLEPMGGNTGEPRRPRTAGNTALRANANYASWSSPRRGLEEAPHGAAGRSGAALCRPLEPLAAQGSKWASLQGLPSLCRRGSPLPARSRSPALRSAPGRSDRGRLPVRRRRVRRGDLPLIAPLFRNGGPSTVPERASRPLPIQTARL
jgi:hypothetical protein